MGAASGTRLLSQPGRDPVLVLRPSRLEVIEGPDAGKSAEMGSEVFAVGTGTCNKLILEEDVRTGRFRQDLYYRLSVVSVRLPPLRERKEEIPRLVRHFASKLRVQDPPEIPPALLAMLANHDWPGNVRELRNFVERTVVLGDMSSSTSIAAGPAAQAAAPIDAPPIHLPYHEAKQQWTERLERAYLTRLLTAHGDNISEAARAAGLSRQSCYRLMEKHGLRGS